MQENPLPFEYDFNAVKKLAESVSGISKRCAGKFSVALIDAQTGLKWMGGSEPYRAASLIKLFVMVQVFEEKRTGRLDFAEKLVMRTTDIVGGAGIMQNEAAGTAKTIEQLVELMITESDNVATNLLVERIGMAAVNRCAQKLGCRDTVMNRFMMDFDAACQGRENYTSVGDVADLLQNIQKGQCVDKRSDRTMCEILGRQTDRCKIPLLLPADTVCLHKTGELPGAEHDAGIITCSRGSYILVIMSDGLTDAKAGIATVASISKAVFDWYCSR